AEQHIDSIKTIEELAYQYIVRSLSLNYQGMISIYIYDSPQDAGWDRIKAMAFPRTETVEAIFSLTGKSIGVKGAACHEIAHVITWNTLGEPGTQILSEGIAVAVGAFDAHMGGVGAGVKEGTLVKILGTSTCDILVSAKEKGPINIPGVCGIVDGSVIPGYYGIEAGQSAVGDIFLWYVEKLVPDRYGKTVDEKFKNLESEALKQRPGEHGLLALDWNNGNRTILADVRLNGLLIGQTLHTEPHEIYRALIEATAFGALTIINRIQEYGVSIKEIINCGGLAAKSPFLMQVYADILGRPMKVSRSDQTPALGAALFGAVAAGEEKSGYKSIEEAQKKMTGVKKITNPNPKHHEIYQKMYALYKKLHDAFGTKEWTGSLYNVMKDLIDLRETQRRGKHA
ncbi:MAG TPA: hypothetical protein ENL46_01490, partial [Candidatus Aminicenantes bacterium]|nr:hypothetical protein [Candidatus Aminicenantes bacterium]